MRGESVPFGFVDSDTQSGSRLSPTQISDQPANTMLRALSEEPVVQCAQGFPWRLLALTL
ncbi:hypothetical protein N7326_05295 [Corynebacterium sp. ES2794-CONJ1]|nr:hypothetical protein [Corynebacterium sp. ES2794-CONJ1]